MPEVDDANAAENDLIALAADDATIRPVVSYNAAGGCCRSILLPSISGASMGARVFVALADGPGLYPISRAHGGHGLRLNQEIA